MPERLFQARLFDSQPQDVTPRGFTRLPEVNRRTQPEFPGPTLEMGRFVREVKGPDRVHILSPGLAAEYLMTHIYTPFATFDQEELWVLLLNNKNLVTHEAMVYRGTVNSAYIRPAEIFKPAVQLNSPTLIISHNHPSGDPSPSQRTSTLPVIWLRSDGLLTSKSPTISSLARSAGCRSKRGV